jgi:hypothetical protein
MDELEMERINLVRLFKCYLKEKGPPVGGLGFREVLRRMLSFYTATTVS